jgi:hypothetical protein
LSRRDDEPVLPWRGDVFGLMVARAICARCPVRVECLDYALEVGDPLLGVWGGTSKLERRRMRGTRSSTMLLDGSWQPFGSGFGYHVSCGLERADRFGKQRWERLRKQIGLQRVRLHDRRHFHGTELAAAGPDAGIDTSTSYVAASSSIGERAGCGISEVSVNAGRGRPIIRTATPRRRGRTGAAASCRGGPARTAGTGGTRAPGAGPLTSRTSASPSSATGRSPRGHSARSSRRS